MQILQKVLDHSPFTPTATVIHIYIYYLLREHYSIVISPNEKESHSETERR